MSKALMSPSPSRSPSERMTYAILAELSGLAAGTLHSMGSRDDYHATLATPARIRGALDVAPGDLLGFIEDSPKAKRVRKKARKR